MNQFEFSFDTRDQNGNPTPHLNRFGLFHHGPLIDVVAGLPPQLAEIRAKAGINPQSPHACKALIDTGATRTSLDKRIATALNLPSNGKTQLGTASGPCGADLIQVSILFPMMNNLSVLVSQAVTCDLSGSGIGVLFGRDLLMQFIMIYNGPMGRISLIA